MPLVKFCAVSPRSVSGVSDLVADRPISAGPGVGGGTSKFGIGDATVCSV